ncbi:MAG TPA: type II toxin-antitoxin system Phd/YefM family antitoxin [Chloroflexota bacterium]|nr:type II toxin-antitoxin system Phd/YefM family antitoxin [Chloroflexota bacterium]
MTATELRKNLYRLLDQVLETGEPLEIERRGQRLRIVPEQTGSKLDRLVPHPDYIAGDPEDFVHIDWSGEWKLPSCSEPPKITWTRDPFDRLIAAHALATDTPLLTKDETIRQHLPLAWWRDS